MGKKVAFLDLARMRPHAESGARDVGPQACISGRIHVLPGQLGTSSQVRLSNLPSTPVRSLIIRV